MSTSWPQSTRTERLTLRTPQAADAEDIYRLADNPRIAHMTGTIPSPYPREAADAWIAHVARQRTQGTALAYAICARGTGTLMGVIGLTQLHDHTANLAYWLGEPYWGQGLCTEAGRAMVEVAFGPLQRQRLMALHLDHNVPSGQVLQKLGFRFTHEVQRLHRGAPRNFRCYALSRTDRGISA